MGSNFLLILAVCGLSTGNQPQPEVVGDVCYEKDESPVDLDALFNEACTDVEGNTYRVGSELHSCCDCFRLEKRDYWWSENKTYNSDTNVRGRVLSRWRWNWWTLQMQIFGQGRSAGWGLCRSGAAGPVMGRFSLTTPRSPPPSWRTTVSPFRQRSAGSDLAWGARSSKWSSSTATAATTTVNIMDL